MGRDSGVVEPQAESAARVEKRAAFAPQKVHLYRPKPLTGAKALIIAVPKTVKKN
jgi:hypothetical protein